jgi:hypothetical protein
MPDLEKLNVSKEKIVSLIKLKGPSLPVQIARAINQPPLFTSAFLSELFRENRLRMSHMKVGSSPLYLIRGQEPLLENFTEHLNQREREAFLLLKENQLLEDSVQSPITRVALRSIKDFAIPLKIRINGESKLFWKYFTLQDKDIRSLLQGDQPEPPLPHPDPSPEEPEPPAPKPEPEPAPEKERKTKTARPKTPQVHKFPENIKSYLGAKDIEILSILSEKKKEFSSKVRIDTQFGKQEFLLIAKDKKKITENDLTLSLQKAQAEKMPALIISPGELDKKSQSYLKEWKNLIKFEKIKF